MADEPGGGRAISDVKRRGSKARDRKKKNERAQEREKELARFQALISMKEKALEDHKSRVKSRKRSTPAAVAEPACVSPPVPTTNSQPADLAAQIAQKEKALADHEIRRKVLAKLEQAQAEEVDLESTIVLHSYEEDEEEELVVRGGVFDNCAYEIFQDARCKEDIPEHIRDEIKRSQKELFEESTKSLVTKQMRWKKGELLGRGSFGKVYLGTRMDTMEHIAVKVIEIVGSMNNTALLKEVACIRNEITLLQGLKHPNVVKFLGTGRANSGDAHSLTIFMEYIEGGSLAVLISQHVDSVATGFDDEAAMGYAYQLSAGLKYLHGKTIVHRDIKPANVLVQNRKMGPSRHCLKIADFGMGRYLEDLGTASMQMQKEVCAFTFTGTPHYMAPEVVQQTGHGRKADIWSLGCTVIELMTGSPPWVSLGPMKVLLQLATTEEPPPFPPSISDDGAAFLLQCFTRDCTLRPPASELCNDPWFAVVKSAIDAAAADMVSI